MKKLVCKELYIVELKYVHFYKHILALCFCYSYSYFCFNKLYRCSPRDQLAVRKAICGDVCLSCVVATKRCRGLLYENGNEELV